MKKINAILYVIIALLYLNTSSLLAEESQASTDNNNSESRSPQESDQEYVLPKPQASRIESLKSTLTLRQLDHQIQTLEANGESFLTLYNPSLTRSTEGCVILLHSDNEHPDWPDAIGPLRNALPEHSWCTLAIEVPDIIKRAAPVQTSPSENSNNQESTGLPNQANVFARVEAAMNRARTDGIEQFVLLGYKTGASYALAFLAENPEAGEALILIDIESPTALSDYTNAQKIRQISKPTLDYYVNNNGSERFALWRKQAANQRTESDISYIQIDAIPDRVTGKNSKQLLIQRVRGFLKQNTTQITQQKQLPNIKKGLFYKSPVE
ncbi:uncharacterized protein DUF3530 [Marinomonas alcarazii]|uniref:Uncharacterized protein DUF3530 n=1 Tax=Marinomonas alcarazii TaxID=491949 RepID=A0A318VCP1_9GAMM|nr:DUF3530 family protein [Marinomonas alcarazii]PYF81619.1 uncharacterized protein DUF3530 [Marinomonas alcarazii]